ncbi:MAG: GWxTD domain-containing protein [Bacteroidales bacterium]|nr:GWxTD domain-containing protein [Bacteroidales bacterium]MBN2632521.1 GWxTD domain-containing protein [Bacteroidales bacterium]
MKKAELLKFIIPVILAVMLSGFIISCKTSAPVVDSKDLSYLYNPIKNPVNPKYNITNVSDNQSNLAIKFFSSELSFSEANPQGIPTASMAVTVKLFSTATGMILTDTAYHNLNIIKEDGRIEYVYNISLRVSPGIKYIAEVKILDRLRSLVMQSFVPFNTLSLTNSYNYRARGHFGKNELFNPVLRVDEFVNLSWLRGLADSLYIAYYKPYTTIPDPPSMILPEKAIDYGPDTTIALPYSDTLPIMFPKRGIYLCSVDSNLAEGYSFFNFGPSFPQMNAPETMIEALAYLASEVEMRNLLSAERPKMALDEFWIKCGGNVERARELIRIYYTRVVYANYYFTSYKEGWRTERGMIYIIYGPPDKVYKGPEGENWGYRKPVIKSSWGTRYKVQEDYLWFTFKKKEATFSDNDYFISRSETLVTFWEQAIDSWRKGIVFRLDNPQGL